MSEDAGSGMRAGSDFLQVGTADAAGMNPQQQFAGANLGNGHSFHADIVNATIDGRLHGSGNRPCKIVHGVLSGDGHNSTLMKPGAYSLQKGIHGPAVGDSAVRGSAFVNFTSTIMESR